MPISGKDLRKLFYDAVFDFLDSQGTNDLELVQPITGTLEVEIHAAWAGVNNFGDSNNVHVHPDSVVSGAYYVSEGGAKTDIFHIDPRTRCSGDVIQTRTSAGTIVVFPSWMEHYVPAHTGREPRIIVAFNTRVRHVANDQKLSWKIPTRHQ